eukprot:UN21055
MKILASGKGCKIQVAKVKYATTDHTPNNDNDYIQFQAQTNLRLLKT